MSAFEADRFNHSRTSPRQASFSSQFYQEPLSSPAIPSCHFRLLKKNLHLPTNKNIFLQIKNDGPLVALVWPVKLIWNCVIRLNLVTAREFETADSSAPVKR